MKILLVEPEFPVAPKSRNHKDFLPLPLLKIGSYYRRRRDVDKIELVRGNKEISYEPDRIFITSLFTYWSGHFWDSVIHYRKKFPNARIQVGGLYVSLFYDNEEFKRKCRENRVMPHKGILRYAEGCSPDYTLLDGNPTRVDYQIIHASRGCTRKCDFCGTWKIEPVFETESSIIDKIIKRKIVFYDNNFLANPHVKKILEELIELKREKRILWCESQSGFDGRMLLVNPELGRMIREAGFRYPRIAWDGGYKEHRRIKKQADILIDAGYSSKDLSIFMLYNWKLPFKEMEKKRVKCWDWQVQVADCRYRPLDQTFDRFNPRMVKQTGHDYHIHSSSGWTDALIRQFRKNVRRHNICVRHGFPFYSKDFEQKRLDREIMKITKTIRTGLEKEIFLRSRGLDYWDPGEVTFPETLGSIGRRLWLQSKTV